MLQDIHFLVTGAQLISRWLDSAASMPGRRACAYSRWWAKAPGPSQRGGEALSGPTFQSRHGSVRGGGLQPYLEGQSNSPNDQSLMFSRSDDPDFVFSSMRVWLLPGKGNAMVVRTIRTTLYRARVLCRVLDTLFYFVSIAADLGGSKEYYLDCPILQKREWDLGILSNVSKSHDWW